MLSVSACVFLLQLAGEMARAARSASSPAHGEQAAAQVFDEHLDTAVAIGWANTERFCMMNFAQVWRTTSHSEPIP